MSTNLRFLNSEELYSEICREKQSDYTRPDVEERVEKFKRTIWKNRHEIWFDGMPTDPVEMLNPGIGAVLIGFRFDEVTSLGAANQSSFEVAGIIDNKARKILISAQQPADVRTFTAAHELGHAVLHRETGLHRDRPFDGASSSSRSAVERQADWFATAFLMPEKLVRDRFKAIFLTDRFLLDQDTAFALGFFDYRNFVNRFKTPRQLARILASTGFYNGQHVIPLAKQFKVSDEAMAIRLEELALLTV